MSSAMSFQFDQGMLPQSIDCAQVCIPALRHYVSVSVVWLVCCEFVSNYFCLLIAYVWHLHSTDCSATFIKKKQRTFHVDCYILLHFKLGSCLLWLTRHRWLRDSNLLRLNLHGFTLRRPDWLNGNLTFTGSAHFFASQQKWKWKWKSRSLGLWWTGRPCETGYIGITKRGSLQRHKGR